MYRALKEKYDAFVRQAEERLSALLTSFSVKHIDQALIEYSNSCDILEPLLDKLRNHRLQARLSMSTKMQTAARGTDAIFITQILADALDFGSELTLERENLQDRLAYPYPSP